MAHPILSYACSWSCACACAFLVLACGCSADPARPPAPAPPAPPASASGSPAPGGCRAAVIKSDDACTTDPDCGLSEPCHAKACVAKARSKPRTSDTICTEQLVCPSSDTHNCGCVEGHCALTPRPPTP